MPYAMHLVIWRNTQPKHSLLSRIFPLKINSHLSVKYLNTNQKITYQRVPDQRVLDQIVLHKGSQKKRVLKQLWHIFSLSRAIFKASRRGRFECTQVQNVHESRYSYEGMGPYEMYTNRAAQPERVSPGAYHPPWHQGIVSPRGIVSVLIFLPFR